MALLSILSSASLAAAPISGIHKIPRPAQIHRTRALEVTLAALDREQKVEARQCDKFMAEAREVPYFKGLYDIHYKVLLDTPTIFSVKVDSTIYCGGPYPSDSHSGLMFDPRSGQRLNPFQMFAIATKLEHGYVLNPAAQDMLKHAMLANKKSRIAQDCRAILTEAGSSVLGETNVVLGKDGLHIMYPLPHVVAACYTEVVFTHKQLKTF